MTLKKKNYWTKIQELTWQRSQVSEEKRACKTEPGRSKWDRETFSLWGTLVWIVTVPKINRDGKGDSRPVSHSSLVTPEIFKSTKRAS